METNTISHSVPWKLFGVIGATVALLVGVGIAHAAPLNFVTAESITISSYPTTLTIATGSVADALGVNATSVLVMLSNTTGGSFTLLSPSYDLSVATSSGGGTATISCSGGIETAVLSQGSGSTVYTITPTTQNCADASAPIITISPSSTNVTVNSVTIGWTTNIAADSTVSYGMTTSYGATSTDPTLVYAHSILLTGLSAATLYNYKVTSAEYGTSTTSGDYTFTTASTDAPTVSMTAPANGATVQGTSVTLSAVATPSEGNTIASVQFYLDGSLLGESTSSPYSINWDTTQTSNASHNLTAIATDGAGNATTSQAISVTVYNAPPVSSGGGGGGGVPQSAFIIVPTATSTTSSTTSASSTASSSLPLVIPTSTASSTAITTSSLQAELNILLAELQSLEAQAGASSSNTSSSYAFTTDLELHDTGPAVNALQSYLIQEDTGPAAQRLKVHGTTDYFGILTYNALVEFQASVGIHGTGYFGPITRAYVNGHE